MSCYHPLLGIPYFDSAGILKYMPSRPLNNKDHFDDIKVQNEVALSRTGKKCVMIPCGHCIGCRLDYSRSWADRMMLELETAKKAVFLTLTYDNEHIHWSQFDEKGDPLYSTLDKRDFQLFMKRLRREFDGRDGEHPFRKIRFFASGEYGECTLRSHMHGIIFGIGRDDFADSVPCGRNELQQIYYHSDRLDCIWDNGYVLLSDVSWKTCAYVARYVVKKLNGPESISYAERNCIPEFSLMSRKPGIGKEYLDLHPECLDVLDIPLSTPEGALKIRIPKYYYDQLKYVPKKKDKFTNEIKEVPEENPLLDLEKYDRIMSDRKKYAEDSMLIELSKTDLSFLDYLEMKEQKKLKSAKLLKRGAI